MSACDRREKSISAFCSSTAVTLDSVLNGLPEEIQELTRHWHASGWTSHGCLTTPKDVGHAAALLCSEAASWITSQVIAVDGGASLMDTVFSLDIQRG
jgi:enoyl-[acyl-carrier-protein] reductase (NADH)